jgi:hypothetical protein
MQPESVSRSFAPAIRTDPIHEFRWRFLPVGARFFLRLYDFLFLEFPMHGGAIVNTYMLVQQAIGARAAVTADTVQ